jgi:SAM-dependent methyltransferase
MPGHWVLARLGKRVLRPGGVELTRRMLDALDVSPRDAVVEFAPGLGLTARLTLERRPASYVAIERDPAAAGRVLRMIGGRPNQRCVVGDAEATGPPDGCATVVYGEAMLTMQPPEIKRRIIREAARLLKTRGRYGVHEICFRAETTDEELRSTIRRELSAAIHHGVQPLPLDGWESMMSEEGLTAVWHALTPMRLLEPARMIRDEGIPGALRFVWNLLRDGEARRRVLAMRRTFRRFEPHLAAVVLVAEKRGSAV